MSLGTYLRQRAASIYFLSDPASVAFLGGLGDTMDALGSLALEALRYHRIDDCPADGLDPLARTSALPRLGLETDANVRDVVRSRWDYYAGMGVLDGLQDQLARVGCTNVKVYSESRLFADGFTTAFGGETAFYFVEIGAPNPFRPPPTWDGGEDWDGGKSWDLTEPYPGAAADLIALCRRWKEPGSSCRFVRLLVGDAWVTIPVGETWEYNADGGATDYYLTHI